MKRAVFVAILAALTQARGAQAGESGVQAGAAAANLVATDSLVIGGGIEPAKATGQEGELRASAVVIRDPKGARVALIECDVLVLSRDILDSAARRIEKATGIPFDNILINATHTHHGPSTVNVHGYSREEEYTKQVGDKAVEAAVAANARLTPVTMRFRLGEESSVGQNSRLLLKNGMINWIGILSDAVRPTGPFDPELPVWAFQKPDGSYEAILYNHSTHTIGSIKPGVRSPSFYGLAAQELEKEKGGTVLFFEGASGSTHNMGLTVPEMIVRMKQAILEALAQSSEHPVSRVKGIRSEFPVKVRHFDEAKDAKAVADYLHYRFKDNPQAEKTVADVFAARRKELATHQGETRQTWIQAIQIGDTAVVGVPAEFFTVLGQEIKRRSPFRYTYVFELANDFIGYVGDRKAYDLGGYQVWTGLHSFVEPGTGEKIVDEAVRLLGVLHAEAK